MDLMMLPHFPLHQKHLSYAATTSAASHDIHPNKRFSSMICGVDTLLHGDRSAFLGDGKSSYEDSCQMAQAAEIQGMPLEIIQHIYKFLPDIESVHALSATSSLFHRAYASSQKLTIVERVLETQFGPLHDVVQIVTLNASQRADQVRNPSFSLALAKQIVAKGRTANKWVFLYPMLRWRVKPENRRFLHRHERHRLRRAIYRLWLYNSTFGTAVDDISCVDTGRRLIKQYPTRELRELDELRAVFYDMLTYDCCPSNSTIQLHYNQGLPAPDLLYFGTYDSHTSDGILYAGKLKGRSVGEVLVAESWGDYISVAREVMRLLYLSPDELLHFREVCTCKADRERFLEELEYDVRRSRFMRDFSHMYPLDSGQIVDERGDEALSGAEREWITGDEEVDW